MIPISKYANLVNSSLVEKIEDYIESHHLTSGDRLPAEREFSVILGVSRMTLRGTIRKLCEAGSLQNIQGKGTFISPERIERRLSEFEIPKQDSYKLISLQKMRADGSTARQLKVSSYGEVYQIKRLRTAGNERVSFETSYIPVQQLKTINLTRLEKNPMCAIYGSTIGKHLTKTNINISIGQASFEESEWLKIPEGDYVTVEKHTIYRNNIPIEFYISVSSAHKVKYSATLVAENHTV